LREEKRIEPLVGHARQMIEPGHAAGMDVLGAQPLDLARMPGQPVLVKARKDRIAQVVGDAVRTAGRWRNRPVCSVSLRSKMPK
jgi:hypothetical protein